MIQISQLSLIFSLSAQKDGTKQQRNQSWFMSLFFNFSQSALSEESRETSILWGGTNAWKRTNKWCTSLPAILLGPRFISNAWSFSIWTEYSDNMWQQIGLAELSTSFTASSKRQTASMIKQGPVLGSDGFTGEFAPNVAFLNAPTWLKHHSYTHGVLPKFIQVSNTQTTKKQTNKALIRWSWKKLHAINM